MIELFAPKEFWKLTDAEKSQFGCGPGRGIGDLLVPDKIFGLDVQPACAIHDFMYRIAEPSIKAKEECDRTFLNNMIRIIEAETTNKCLKQLRLNRAYNYYVAVVKFGGPAFWKGKNKREELGIV